MVVCAMQSFAQEQQLNKCKAMKALQTTQIRDAGIVDNGKGAKDDDREEGEIVDEFEMIISSEDEEFKLRARIQQLEDKSKDIEKMEMLSANLANQYNYQRPQRNGRYSHYQHFSPISVLSDVSSLSEEEFEPPKKHRKHKAKRMEPKIHNPQLRRNPFANRTQRPDMPPLTTARKKRRHERHKNHYNQQQQQHQNQQQQLHLQQPQPIVFDIVDSVTTEDEIGEYDGNAGNDIEDDYEELEKLKLSRDELRVALARSGNYDIKPKQSLKERLQCRLRKSPSPNPKEHQLKPKDELSAYGNKDDVLRQEEQQQQQQEQHHSPQIDEPPELKLRIIALKSAILKKHMARKKRDAERAYSPTDMINRVHPPTISNECADIDDLMEISPAASPERTAYFPPPPATFGEPVDMDLAQTDSDEDRQHSGWPHSWQTSVNTDGNWRCFLPNSLPPVSMPIIIDDDDEEEEQQQQQRQRQGYLSRNGYDDDVTPPPPSFHIPHMQLEDDDARDAMHLCGQHSPQGSFTDIQSISMDNSETQTRTFHPESSDDEAGALRAMLLSKLKPAAATAPTKESKVCALKKEADTHDSDDPDELRLILLSSIAGKKKNCPEETPDDSPEILKKAVLRFQVSSMQSNEASSQEQFPVTAQPVPLPVPAPLAVRPALPQPPAPPPQQPVKSYEDVPTTPALKTKTIHRTNSGIIKIVKPNKVINKKTAPKRKITKLLQHVPPLKRPTTLLVKESVAPLHVPNGCSSTRLITTLDPALIKANKLVITLAESSAGSDDEMDLRNCDAYSSYTNYVDNPSPFSQVMDSASNSTTRSNTPNSEILLDASSSTMATNNNDLRRTVINEYFEKKLDDFLKQARSKVPTTLAPLSKPNQDAAENAEKAKLPEKPVLKTSPVQQQSNKTKPTPVAVRHLPVASQKEYLRLIERMQLLEKKKSVETAKGAGTAITASKKDNAAAANVKAKPEMVKNLPEIKAKETIGKETTIGANKSNELPTTSTKPTLKMPSKESRLKAFENSFLKIGVSMITNLEKSLHMVEEAKKSKIARLRYSHRFEELFAEMQSVKQAMKLEEAKLSRIQPEIQASHEIIISLKQKRNKLRNAAMDLGNGLHGPDYRLLDLGKAEIMRKSTKLTKEIRLYNTIVKYEDTLTLMPEETTAEVEPEVETEVKLESATLPESSAQSIAEVISPKPAENVKEEKLPIECDTMEKEEPQQQPVAPSEEAVVPVNVETQLDVDTTPKVSNSKELMQPVQDVPPYTVSFMRELCSTAAGREQEEDCLLGEYRTPMSRNYNSQPNINATVCPFELMGRCEDVDCLYLHLERVEDAKQVAEAKTEVPAGPAH